MLITLSEILTGSRENIHTQTSIYNTSYKVLRYKQLMILQEELSIK